MNERIKKLEKQSLDYFWSLDDSVRTTDTFTANSEFTKQNDPVTDCVNIRARCFMVPDTHVRILREKGIK